VGYVQVCWDLQLLMELEVSENTGQGAVLRNKVHTPVEEELPHPLFLDFLYNRSEVLTLFDFP
jgi:hypothetical protein